MINTDIKELARHIEEARKHSMWIEEKVFNSDPLHKEGDAYDLAKYFIENHQSISKLNSGCHPSLFKIPCYRDIITINRQSLNLKSIKPLTLAIRTLSLFYDLEEKES